MLVQRAVLEDRCARRSTARQFLKERTCDFVGPEKSHPGTGHRSWPVPQHSDL